ncbi:ABC transporter permease [Aquabacterium humicola]|uniref:ABC transporter permease n=1 Tax=Aquabacterium humicola TaxID=3237377 RepID=UPI0025432CFD|nr:ABC transporter permease [Rubrivivax pictus]
MSLAVRALHRIDPSHLVVLALSLALALCGVAVNDAFATTGNLSNLLEQSVAVGLVSLGQTVVVLAGGIDLAVGALVSALGVLFATQAERHPDAAGWLLAGTLAAGAGIGALNAALILLLRLHALVVTIGMAALLNGLTLMVTRQPAGSVPAWVQEIAYGQWAGWSYAGLGMLAAFAALGVWLRHAPGGLRLLAAGGQPEAARVTGLGAGRATVIAFTLSGLCAGCAAVVLVARTGTGDPLVGEPLTLASITPVVIGGTLLGGGKGGVLGTLLGVFMLVLLGNVLNYMNVSTFLQWTIQGLIIIAAVLFQRRRGHGA